MTLGSSRASALVICPRGVKTCPRKDVSTNVHTSLLVIDKKWRQLSCLATEGRMENGVRHIVECYSAMKRNGVLAHATTWMNLESMMLS